MKSATLSVAEYSATPTESVMRPRFRLLALCTSSLFSSDRRKFGNKALRAFQAKRGLQVDGAAGPATLETAPDNPKIRPHVWLNEVLSPLWAMLDTRDARGVYARDALYWYVSDASFLHFGLCRLSANIPLGWVLSRSTRDRMEKQLASLESPPGQARPACRFDNAGNLEKIGRRLSSLKPRAGSR